MKGGRISLINDQNVELYKEKIRQAGTDLDQ